MLHDRVSLSGNRLGRFDGAANSRFESSRLRGPDQNYVRAELVSITSRYSRDG